MTTRNELLTTTQAAAYVNMSPRTLERYRVTGEGPKYLKLGRLVFYRQGDLDEWLDARVRRSTSDPGPGGGHEAKTRTARRRSNRHRAISQNRGSPSDSDCGASDR